MQVALGLIIIAIMVATYKVRKDGLPTIERTIARWLLADASSWEAKEKAKAVATKKLAKLA